MTAKELISQYVDTGLKLPEYQVNKLSNQDKKTYIRKRLIAVQSRGYLDWYEMELLNPDERDTYISNLNSYDIDRLLENSSNKDKAINLLLNNDILISKLDSFDIYGLLIDSSDRDKIINILLLTIIFVFDPLAISLVIAANFAFAQIRPKKETSLEENVDGMRKVVEAYDDLEDELKDWDSTLQDGLEGLEWDEYGNPSPIIKEEPKPQTKGTPLMFDPETGKAFYVVEDDPEPINLDLDSDGVVEEEELQEVFEQADTNDDGVIDEEEAKAANLYYEQVQELNDLKQSLDILETINQGNNYEFQWKKDKISEEIQKIKDKLLKKFNKDDDNTITYF